ncbi:MAG: hypothetical protein RIQ93_2474, partial [Verrucomicrobiota bacterium]
MISFCPVCRALMLAWLAMMTASRPGFAAATAPLN